MATVRNAQGTLDFVRVPWEYIDLEEIKQLLAEKRIVTDGKEPRITEAIFQAGTVVTRETPRGQPLTEEKNYVVY